MSNDILIIDDEKDIRELIEGLLEDEGYEARVAFDAESGLAEIAKRVPQLIFLDIWLQGSRLDGLELLSEIVKLHPDLPVVMISGHGNIETAVNAVKLGAYDYVEKPFKIDRLLQIAERALERYSLKQQITDYKKNIAHESEMLGVSNAFAGFRHNLQKMAATNARILLRGGAGSGKESAARWIHEHSPRAQAPFVTINAAAITPELFEITLFGQERNKSGQRVIGTLEKAHGGTLFLEEIAEMHETTQGKLLRVLSEQRFMRIGGDQLVEVDVRIISSTTRDIEKMIEQNQYRADLFHRLSVVPIRVPSLEERIEDLPQLAEHFAYQIAKTIGRSQKSLSPDLIVALQSQRWPGNVRQLRNTIERLMILADEGDELTAEMFKNESRNDEGINSFANELILSLPLREAREAFEREYLRAQITRFGGNVSKTSEFVGMERSALHRKMKSLGIGASETQ